MAHCLSLLMSAILLVETSPQARQSESSRAPASQRFTSLELRLLHRLPCMACCAGRRQDLPSNASKPEPEAHACCPGYFCPAMLTCMLPCPLGAYCPR